MSNITVYQKMTSSMEALRDVVNKELGVKACVPFAVRAYEALGSLGDKLTEAEARKAANTFLDNLQTLTQGGIITDDYDKIDFVKRGKVICLSARVEALTRAAARKGYRIQETIVAVPKADAASTYFEENFYEGQIIYTLKDKRLQGDRKITAERLISKYFDKFICRLEMTDIKANKRLLMSAIEMSNEEVISAAAASDNGIYKSKWETYKDDWGNQRKRKAISDELNDGSIWNVWTADMVYKTVMRRALKRVKEILPELKDTIYAFDTDAPETEEKENPPAQPNIEIKAIAAPKVNIFDLTEAQKVDANEILEIYKANPKLAEEYASIIKAEFENGRDLQQICNEHYAQIAVIASKKVAKDARPIIEEFLKAAEEMNDE